MIQVLLEIILALLVFFVIYKAVLEQTAMHRFKRSYLLFCLVFSFAIPFLHFETSNKIVRQLPSSEVMTETVIEVFAQTEPRIIESKPIDQVAQVAPQPQCANNLPIILISIYGLVTLILLFRYGNGVFQIIKKAKNGKQIPYQGAKIILLNEAVVPHNFLNYIFMNREDYKNKAFKSKLITHELGHAKQKHSIDILLIELLKVFFWFNPLYYFYGKVIRQNHEYLADQRVLNSFEDVTAYQKLLLGFVKRTNKIELSLVSPSNYSLTKNRFKMMSFKTTKFGKITRIAATATLVTITSLTLSIETNAAEIINAAAEDLVSKMNTSVFQENNKPDISPLIKEGVHEISSGFGMRIDPISKSRKMHHGTDFLAEVGTPVIATASGIIMKAGDSQNGYGLIVKIKHENELQTLYTQLSKVSVKEGDMVVKGQIIGAVGITGLSTGPHLHYEVIQNGKKVDPSEYLPTFGKNKNRVRGRPSNKDFKVMNEYDLNENHTSMMFLRMDYQKIVYDDTKFIFFKANTDHPIVKSKNDLTQDQILAIHSLKLPPPPPRGKKKPIEAIVNNWHDASQFGVWIDGKRVSNSEMKNYSAKDFAYHFVKELKSDAKDYGKYRYQLDLQTFEKYEFVKARDYELKAEWLENTNRLLDKLAIN